MEIPPRPSKRSLTTRTLRGLIWSISGAGVQGVLQIIILVILARLLTPAEFGLVGVAMVIISFSTMFSQMGIGQAIIQRSVIRARHLRAGFTLSLGLGLFLGLLIYLTAPYIETFFRMEGLVPILKALALIFPLKGISIVSESLLHRELRFRLLSGLEVGSYGLGYGLVGTVLASMGIGVWALVGAHLGQSLLKTAGLLAFKRHPIRPTLDRVAIRELMYFGGGFTLARICNYIATQGDNLVVGRWLGAEALGIYSRAYQLLVTPAVLIGQTIDNVLFPAMAKIQNDPKGLSLAYRRSVGLISLVMLPSSVAFIILAPEIVLLLLGPQWTDVIVPFQILSLGLLFRTSYKMSDSLARATGAVYRRAWRQGVYAFLVLIGSLLGQGWGVPGVAVGVFIAITINFLLMAQLSLSLSGLSWLSFLKANLSGAPLAIVIVILAYSTTFFSRGWGVNDLAILALSGLAMASTAIFLWRCWPQTFLGSDGSWMLNTLMNDLLSRFGFLVRGRREGI